VYGRKGIGVGEDLQEESLWGKWGSEIWGKGDT